MDSNAPESTSHRWLARWLSGILAASALAYLGYHLVIGLGLDDTNFLETPLVLAVARQLRDGPSSLYGPFNGSMPLVLIHAPLYYRLAGLAAWPLAALGCDPVVASLATGRAISMLGLLGTLAVVYRLATLDGAPRRAGLWAVGLIAASRIFENFPVTVRPDTLGIVFQTAGVYLVLKALRDGPPRGSILALAYSAFALAFCVKQHNVVALMVSSGILALAWLRGRVRLAPIVAAHAIALAIVVGYYGLEEFLTRGLMSESVFVLPRVFRQYKYGSWAHVHSVFSHVAHWSVGLLALGAACVVAGPRRALGRRLDVTLMVYAGAEAVLMAALCLNSLGAWTNYAMQAIVFACIVVARGLSRVVNERADEFSLGSGTEPFRVPCPRHRGHARLGQASRHAHDDVGMAPGVDERPQPKIPSRYVAASANAWKTWPVAVAALVLLVSTFFRIETIFQERHDDRAALHTMFTDPAVVGPGSRYFVKYPQLNRLHGRPELAHDEWLYDSYEAARAAEPRALWLRSALTTGPIRQVIVPRDDPNVPGVPETLPELGFERISRFGPYRVWERKGPTGQRGSGTAARPGAQRG